MSEQEHAAVERLAQRGAATPPGAGKQVADYIRAHAQRWDRAELRDLLKNLDGAIRELREELRSPEPFVPANRTRPNEYRWVTPNEDYEQLNDVSSLDVQGDVFVLRCNEQERKFRFEGSPQPNPRLLERLERYGALLIDDPTEAAEAYGIKLLEELT